MSSSLLLSFCSRGLQTSNSEETSPTSGSLRRQSILSSCSGSLEKTRTQPVLDYWTPGKTIFNGTGRETCAAL